MAFVYDPINIQIGDLHRVEQFGMRFYETSTGLLYPSITTVLSVGDKPGLREWRESMGEEAAAAEMARAATRGTALHTMCELWLSGHPNPTTDQHPDHIKLFNRIKMLGRRFGRVYALEQYLYSDTYQIAGTVDCVAEFDGKLSLIDFKSSTNIKHESIIQDYFIQETFYAEAWLQHTSMQIEQLVTIMCAERGLVPLIWKKSPVEYIPNLIAKKAAFDVHVEQLKATQNPMEM